MPTNYGGAVRGAAAGFQIGSAVPIPGASIAGAILGGVAGLFGKSEYEIRKERIQGLLDTIEKNRAARLSEGSTKIRQYTGGLRQGAYSKAIRLARSQGREGKAQSYTLPQTQVVAGAGNKALTGFITDTNRSFDQQRLNVETAAAGDPIEPGVADYLETLAPIATQFKSGMQGLGLLKQSAPGAGSTPISDSFSSGGEIPGVGVQPYSGRVREPGYLPPLRGLRSRSGYSLFPG